MRDAMPAPQSEFSTLDAFGIGRAIRDDDGLSTAQKCLLMMAVLRADGNTGKVRASVAQLARDAGMDRGYAGRVLGTDRVAGYFARVERSPRRVDLWFPLGRFNMVTQSSCSDSAEDSCMVTQSAYMVTQSLSHGDSVDTIYSTSTNTSTNRGPRRPLEPRTPRRANLAYARDVFDM